MNLISKKRVFKKYLFLMNLLCFGASYLACVSCQGMDEINTKPISNKQSTSSFSEAKTKTWVNNANDSTHAGEEESYCFDRTEDSKSPSSLYQLSQSEFFSLNEMVQIRNNPQKLNRRVNEGQIEKLMELREVWKEEFNFEEALLEAKK